MYADAFLQVLKDQAVTTTAVSTDTIDLGTAREVGEGKTLYLLFSVSTAFAGGTSTEFQAIGSAAAGLTSPVVLGTTGAIPTASLTAGAKFAVAINPQIKSTGQRYLGARYVVTGTNTAGAVTADIVETIADGVKFYPSGYTV